MPPAKDRTPELRSRLLDVAIELLAIDGPASVTTRQVASLAATSATSIYELFGDKAGLIRAMCFEGFRRLAAVLDELPAPTGTRQDLVDAVDTYRRFAAANPRLFEVMYTKPFDEYSPSAEERSLGDVTRDFLVNRVEGCVANAVLRGDPTDIAHALLAVVIGLSTQETAGWLGRTRAARDRRWSSATTALLDGFS